MRWMSKYKKWSSKKRSTNLVYHHGLEYLQHLQFENENKNKHFNGFIIKLLLVYSFVDKLRSYQRKNNQMFFLPIGPGGPGGPRSPGSPCYCLFMVQCKNKSVNAHTQKHFTRTDKEIKITIYYFINNLRNQELI